MKIKYTLFFLFFVVIKTFGQGDIYFSENFDSTNKPLNWTYEYVVTIGGEIDWKFQSGGYNLSGTPGGGEPPFPHQGNNNAVFNYVSPSGEATKLITPPINMEFGIKPELRFWHAQATKLYGGTDNLKVYYKNDTSTNWNFLKEYTVEIPEWIEQVIQLPDSTLTDNYYIAFEGITNNGFGTCIDSMVIIETGVIGKTIESVIVRQSSTDEVPTSSINNKILRVDFKVKGNDGNMILDSLAFISLNTNDDNIATNGVKLFYSEDTLFINSELKAFSHFDNGKVSFDDLNIILSTGFSSIWLLYDIKDDTEHNMQNNILDAYIPENGIKINNYYYPFIDKSPEGERKIVESIFNDNFEEDKSWSKTVEFERAIPLGYGGAQNIGSIGKADPTYATSGSYVLGTDLTDDGDYENSLTDREYYASTPTINTKYYIDTKIFFNRWINIQVTDSAYIDLSTDNGNTWINIWQNSDNIREDNWSQLKYDIANYAERKDEIKVRFAIGGTDDSYPMSGWNIDDFSVTGNYLSKDVGITNWIGPLSGCGHTDEELIEVTIQNYAGEPLTDPLVLSYSLDGGATIKYDTIQNLNLAIDASMTHIIDKPADLTTPGWYNNVYATTNLAGDEDSRNDKYTTTLFISPTYNLPYSENFENNYGYFRNEGVNSSWEYGEPDGTVINSAASGTNAWVTNLDGSYQNNDSSFIETPCFDFTNIDSVIFEFKCIGISEDQTDGLAVMYSFDNGTSWEFLPDDHDYYWDWYNETSISELGSAGIDETGSTWLTMRQLLPNNFSKKSSVKFRFLFMSSESAIYEGFGIDDVKIYEAPGDVGVTSINEPYTECEWSDSTEVKVTIKNFGITILKAGSKIPVGLDFQGSYYTTDTLELMSPLAPEGTIEFTFTETVDMSNTGDYDLVVYTLLEDDPYFYDETVCNDTTFATVRVDGMPNYNIGWIVGSDGPDTLLNAGTGYDTYFWDGPVEDSTTQTYRATLEGIYYVTVTRTNTLTCEAYDSLKVVTSLLNVKMDSTLTELEDSCQRFELTELQVTISNQGAVLNANDTIPFGYRINNLPEVYDTLTLDRTLTTNTDPATDTINFTFSEKLDLTVPDEYTIRVFTNFASDLNRNNDTVIATINTWGLPYVDLAYDTIYSSQADTLTLDAGPGFASYLWNPGDSATQTITPINSSYYYHVTVTDVNGCGSDKDSTYIETHDLGITQVTSPHDICENISSANTPINVQITNYSDSSYSSADLKIIYEYDGGLPQEINTSITVGPTGSVTLNGIATVDATSVGEHILKIYTSSEIDANHENDTLIHSFETWPTPAVDLAYDTIFTTKPDTVLLIAHPGYDSYVWNDGVTTNDTLAVSKLTSEKYIVTVTDEHSCASVKDSTQIITYNLGINSLVSPESDCSHSNSEVVKIAVKNYGADIITSGTILPISYELNGNPIHEDYTLTEDLNSLESITIQFATKVDLSAIDLYKFKTYIGFELDANHKNDTLIDAVRTFGYPSVNLGNDILTTQPDTVYLVADPGYNNYQWDDGSNNDSLEVTYLASRSYTVTVYDINGCTATDDINVYTYDVAPSVLNTPVSECVLSNAETVNMDVVNSSQDTLLIGDQINVSYVLNSGSPVNESFALTDSLKPGETVSYTFTQPANLSANQEHHFDLFAERNAIDVETNDDISVSVDYLTPDYDLGGPITEGGTEYTIDAGVGYASYLWFDETTTSRYYTVDINSQNPNNYYAVTVTTSDGCTATDSIEVTFTTTADLSVTELFSPTESKCWNSEEQDSVHIEITNVGVVNIPAGQSFTVGYLVNNGNKVTETFNLSNAMNASDTREYVFDKFTYSSAGNYKFKPFVKLSDDGDVSNDTLPDDQSYTITISQPEVEFVGQSDTIYFDDGDSYEIQVNGSYLEYAWSNGATTASIVVTNEGAYTVTVTDQYDCQAEGTFWCLYNEDTGFDNIISGDGYTLSYYPNPATDKVMVEFDNRKPSDVRIEIVGINGQLLFNTELKDIKTYLESIDVNNYANGIYYLRFRINGDFYTRKLIVQ